MISFSPRIRYPKSESIAKGECEFKIPNFTELRSLGRVEKALNSALRGMVMPKA